MTMVSHANYMDTIAALTACLIANQPALLWGPPGNGKSTVSEGLGDDLDMHVETIIASIFSPSEFSGLPYIDEQAGSSRIPKTDEEIAASLIPLEQMAKGSVRLFPPAWAIRLNEAIHSGRAGAIAFYDEISTAPESVQAAMLRPILNGWVGDLKLHPKVRTIAAANPPDQAAGGWDLTPPAANRFVHLDWELPASVVRDGFNGRWPTVSVPPVSPDAKALLASTKGIIGTFLGSKPDLVTVVPDDTTDAGKAWPSPRSWETLAKVLAVTYATGMNENVQSILANGTVGVAAGNEILNYMANLDLPDPRTLLANPDSWDPPGNRPDIVYAVLAGTLTIVADEANPQTWGAAGTLIARAADNGHADIAVVHGSHWLTLRPTGAMASSDTMRSLQPILKALNLT